MMSCGGIVLNDVFADRQTGLLKSGGGWTEKGKRKGLVKGGGATQQSRQRTSKKIHNRAILLLLLEGILFDLCYGLKLSRATEVQSDQHTTSCVQSSFLYTSFFIIYY